MRRYEIETLADMEAAWADYWPLHDALQEFHAGLGNGRRRPNAEAGSRRRLAKLFSTRPTQVFLARRQGTPIGMATARLVHGGWTRQELVGHLSDFYIKPGARGTTLVLAFLRELENWMRENGRRASEHGSLRLNARTVRLSLRKGYRPYRKAFGAAFQRCRNWPVTCLRTKSTCYAASLTWQLIGLASGPC